MIVSRRLLAWCVLLICVASFALTCGPALNRYARVPVYNVAVTPRIEQPDGDNQRVLLQAGAVATLHFGIGERWPASVVPPQTPSPTILNAPTDLTLTAVMACSFCEEHPAFLRRLTYRPSDGESETVTFEFVPRRPTPEEGDRFEGTLQLSVFDDATEQQLDRVVVPVQVVQDGMRVEAEAASWPGRAVESSPSAPLNADAVLRFYLDGGRHLLVEVNALLPALRSALDPLVRDGEGRLRRFRTPMSQADIAKITTGAYAQASAISHQGDLARQLSRSGRRPIVSAESRRTLALTPLEARHLSQIIADTGQTLYRLLFVEGEDGEHLGRAIAMLEAARDTLGRPVRLHVRSDDLIAPWQYLHPVGGPADPRKFWGVRFDLSAERVSNGAPGPPMAEAAAPPDAVLFARHGSESDVTVPLAAEQVEQLRRLPVQQLEVVRSAAEFLGALQSADRAKLSTIVTFLHATATQDPDGPLILFGDQDVVSARRLQTLPNALTFEQRRAQPRYLGGSPLFILNACETGPSTIAVPHTSFEEVAFQLGAQGVVVTEVSVWVTLGHEVGTRLLSKLGRGETVSHALAEVRRELVDERNNPLGLLYAYYGDPSATLRR